MTNIQRIKAIEDVIENEIRPTIRQDGGDLELIDVVDNRVQVALRGRCAWCRARDFTLDGTVGAKLREMVDPDLLVEDVSERLDEQVPPGEAE